MDPLSVVKAGSEALTLLTALTKLIKENQSKPKTSLSELLAQLRVEALRISMELELKLQSLGTRLLELGLNPDKSLEAQLRDLSWYNWISRARLKAYREEFQSAYLTLTSFIDDATALMLCEATGVLATDMFATAYAERRKLNAIIMDPGRTLGGMLRELSATAMQVSLDLRTT